MPDVEVKWVTLLLHIWEVPASNLTPETSHLTKFLWFSSVIPGKFWIGHDHLLPHPFQFIIQYPQSCDAV
jgi:hypothetical protein